MHKLHKYHNLTTMMVILSPDPEAKAVFIKVREILSGSCCSLSIFCTSLICTKSHNPSLATTKNLWLKRISTLCTSGLTISPIFFFNEKSPKALVIANKPPKRLINILPPACLTPKKYTSLYESLRGYRSDVLELAFQRSYRRRDRLKSLQRGQCRGLVSLTRGSGDRLCLLNLTRICLRLADYLRFRKIIQKELCLVFYFLCNNLERSNSERVYVRHVFN